MVSLRDYLNVGHESVSQLISIDQSVLMTSHSSLQWNWIQSIVNVSRRECTYLHSSLLADDDVRTCITYQDVYMHGIMHDANNTQCM